MGYGSTSGRVPAKGAGGVTTANIFIVNILGRFARGFTTVQRGIFDPDSFRKNMGGFNSSFMSPYVFRTLYNTLFQELKGKVEFRLLGYVASDSAQASYAMLDSTPQTLYTAKCSKKGVADKSLFGNNVCIKSEIVEKIKYTLQSDMLINGTEATLTSVEFLKVGYKIHLNNGTDSVYRQILTIDPITKKVTFAAVGVAVTFLAVNTTITLVEHKITIGEKMEKGNIEIRETWKAPFFKGNSDGLPNLMGNQDSGSYYLTLEYNAANTSLEGADLPANLTDWTFLTGGLDGTAPGDSDWNTLVAGFANDKAGFLLAPESSSVTHNQNMALYSSNGQRWNYYANIPSGSTEDSLQAFGASLRSVVQFGQIPMDKRFKTIDPVTDEKLEVPNIGYAVAHYFNYLYSYSEAKVAAGYDIPINTADEMIDNGLVHDDEAGIGERLITKSSVNIATKTANGIFINSARTLSSDPGYQWQHQLMTYLIDRNTIVEFDKKYEQAIGGDANQKSRAKLVEAYLRNRFNAGIYYNGFLDNGKKAKFEDSVILQLDGTNNPLSQLMTGKETLFYQFKSPYVVENPHLEIASAPLSYTFVQA